MQSIFAKEVLLTGKGYNEIVNFATVQLRKQFPKISLTKKHLSNSLNSLAYQWLQHLLANPPKASWFPKFAVEIAHKAFRFEIVNCKLQTFKNYLRKGQRWNRMKLILPLEGMFLFKHILVSHNYWCSAFIFLSILYFPDTINRSLQFLPLAYILIHPPTRLFSISSWQRRRSGMLFGRSPPLRGA